MNTLRARRKPGSRVLGWIVDEVIIMRKYGRPRPDHLLLSQGALVLFVDPSDRRGRFLMRHGDRRAAHLKQVWQWAVADFAPTIVVDVGLNFGEFPFSATYPDARRIIGVEANRLSAMTRGAVRARVRVYWGSW